jgi:hypothetical protein
MQQLTVGDTYAYTLVETNGVTPLPTANIQTVVAAILPPSGPLDTATPVTLAGNVATFTTTLQTFPSPGTYQLQFIVTYTTGVISKSRVYPIQILPSID